MSYFCERKVNTIKMDEVDVEDENILTSIFKDYFPDWWQENPDFVLYLVELSSYGVERLAREPDRLAEEKAQILAETQDLAFHNYTTFIQTANCSHEIFQDFQIIEQNLENLLEKLPLFSQQCSQVIQKAPEITASRRMNTLTLQRHTQLLEVLEMPQLMDTCVRNGYYEEALELAVHVKRMEKKYPNIPVIANIVKEVKSSTQLMLNQLIQQLRSNLQLPACLRIIGFLRRMDVFTEAELRIKFLQARDTWFQSILETIPKGDAYTHITKTIEVSRVHLFDIMTQFRAIFSDEDPLISTGREDTVHESVLFHSWVLHKISQFLVTLENDLNENIGGRLDSLLGQCMYFGLSFSRVGADFRGLLAPIFERAALRYFSSALKEANGKFEESMQTYNLLGVSTTSGLPLGLVSSQAGSLYPPTTLLEFYPLVTYCNYVLTAFNDLRLCSPVTLACKVTDEMHKSLLDVNKVILAFHRVEETAFNAQEKDQFTQFCVTYTSQLLPYLNRCLTILFPPAQLATGLGITVSELSKKNNVGLIDIASITAGLSHLIPASVTQATDPEEEAQKPVTFTIESDSEDSHNSDLHQSPSSPVGALAPADQHRDTDQTGRKDSDIKEEQAAPQTFDTMTEATSTHGDGDAMIAATEALPREQLLEESGDSSPILQPDSLPHESQAIPAIQSLPDYSNLDVDLEESDSTIDLDLLPMPGQEDAPTSLGHLD